MAGAMYKTSQRLLASSFSRFVANISFPLSCSLSTAATHINCSFSGSSDVLKEVRPIMCGWPFSHGNKPELVARIHSSATDDGVRKIDSTVKDEDPLDDFYTDGEDDNLNDDNYEQEPHKMQDSFKDAKIQQDDQPIRGMSWDQERSDPNFDRRYTGFRRNRSSFFGDSDAVLAKLQRLRRGPDGRFVNLVEVISDLDILLDAYQKVKAGPNGNPAEVRVDNICLDWFVETQAKLRNGTFKFKPVKRVLIRKKPPGRGKRRRAPDLEPKNFDKK
ncbi:hypothetical protein O6H91_13G088900 [Diphasiastrum complanatum]|uniref:Uncharacterized protein n=1 Tax=Diphasiastrum complanatum TaxID=34168 RepID=A0ACC2BX01_DIPCM|nr:hypothetical protein O6H91_Y354600 [Diphasiastrum complanatum]KAJ7534303.1 hypothetical protein O6H91_13G088900 [Diphasiastrum complanatum]